MDHRVGVKYFSALLGERLVDHAVLAFRLTQVARHVQDQDERKRAAQQLEFRLLNRVTNTQDGETRRRMLRLQNTMDREKHVRQAWQQLDEEGRYGTVY